ncbi:hypothetical protein L3Y34_005734 [Caenorhabditis briggsae]|uniref:Uncharacterized protein n=1 Tax=Caenorhabditis briggsae TaxID=6238 RepID=A0AAE9D7T1_CAEBR|nr:hypothetical protein L3Y34_005734 [Caenorhabditis briggsae]
MTTVVQNQDETGELCPYAPYLVPTLRPPRLTRREKRKYDKILMGFLPIARNDVFRRRNMFSQIVNAFAPQIEGAPAHDERLYELSEMQVLCQPNSNVLSICEQGETEIHEWTLLDKEATKRTIQDGKETASEVFKVLPGDRDFMLNLLTRFYTERSKCEFDKFGITIEEEEDDLHDWPFLTSINTKEVVLKLPSSMVTITDRLNNFLLTLITYPLQKSFLECSPELFYEICKRKILPSPKLWLSFTSFDYDAVKVNTSKWLHLTCTKKTIRLNEFQKVFELYADPDKNGWHFEIEMPHIKEEMIVITQLTSNSKRGFSKRKYQEKVAASKKLENNLEVVAYFNDSESVWIVETVKFESKELTPEPPILEVSSPKPKEKITQEPNAFRFFKSVILDFKEFKLTCDGQQEKYKSEFDAQKALKELLEECPKYHIKSMVIIGTYILFCRSPLLSVSKLTLLYEDPHMFSFFTPFRHCRFEKLTVSTEDCLENFPSFTTQAKKFIALDKTPIEPEVEEPPKTTVEPEVEEPPKKRAKNENLKECSLEPTNTSASHCSPESAQTRRSSRRTTKRTRKPTPEASSNETPRRKSRRSIAKRETTPSPPESTSPPMAVSPKDSPKESTRERSPRERSSSTTSSRRTRSRTRCRAPSRSVTPPQTPPRHHRSRLPTPIISSRSPSPFSRDLAAAIALSLEPQNNHVPSVYRRTTRPPLDYNYIPYFSSRYVPEPIFVDPILIECCSYKLEPVRSQRYDPFEVRLSFSSPPARYSSPFETNRYQNDWPEPHMLAAEYNTIEYQDDFENLPGPSSMY